MQEGGHHLTGTELEMNLAAKLEDKRVLSDIPPLLAAGQSWNPAQAAGHVVERLCPLLP